MALSLQRGLCAGTCQCRVPPLERPALVLSAEAELGIAAGLQDRVIQVRGSGQRPVTCAPSCVHRMSIADGMLIGGHACRHVGMLHALRAGLQAIQGAGCQHSFNKCRPCCAALLQLSCDMQVYGGVVYMDFQRTLVEERGHGRCAPGGRQKLQKCIACKQCAQESQF